MIRVTGTCVGKIPRYSAVIHGENRRYGNNVCELTAEREQDRRETHTGLVRMLPLKSQFALRDHVSSGVVSP